MTYPSLPSGHPFGSFYSMPCAHTSKAGGDCHPDDELGDDETAEQCHVCRRWYRDSDNWPHGGYCSQACRDHDNPPERG